MIIQRELAKYGARSIPKIVSATGASYNTVKYVLNELHAEVVPGSWPREYRMGSAPVSEGIIPRLSSSEPGDIDISLSIKNHDDWIVRWNKARKVFALSLGNLEIEASDDPAKLADRFAVDAQSLAGLAYALKQVSDIPDWFQALGGSTEEEA